MKPHVFYEVCDGSPEAEPFEPGWGMYANRKEAIAKLKKVRREGFPGAFLAKVTYQRCPEPVSAKR